MTEVSTVRRWILRAGYLFIAVGLGLMIWPGIVSHPPTISHPVSVVRALLGAVGLLALIGLRYPVQMIPLLLFELVWKVIWLAAFALPAALRGPLDPAWSASVVDTGVGILVVIVLIPWRHVLATYVRRPAEPWRARRATSGVAAGRA